MRTMRQFHMIVCHDPSIRRNLRNLVGHHVCAILPRRDVPLLITRLGTGAAIAILAAV
jgi:hypothetical protein